MTKIKPKNPKISIFSKKIGLKIWMVSQKAVSLHRLKPKSRQ